MEKFIGFEKWLKEEGYDSWRNYISYMRTVAATLSISEFENISSVEQLIQLSSQLETNTIFLTKTSKEKSTILSAFKTYTRYIGNLSSQLDTKVWRIGSNWGGINILPVFKNHNIAYAGKEVEDNFLKVNDGDLVAITSGQAIVAIGKANGLDDLKSYESSYATQYEDVKAISFARLFFADDFPAIDFGIYDGQGKQFHQAHGIYVENIKNLYTLLNTYKMNEKLIDIIHYKKQVILQGPPGTGKTKLAKELAASLVGFVEYSNNDTTISDVDIVSTLKGVVKLSTVAGRVEYEIISVNVEAKNIVLKKSTDTEAAISFDKIKEAYEKKYWEVSINNNDTRRATAIAKFIFDKRNASKKIEDLDEFKLIQFHPGYSYEDFVRGIVAESKGDKIEYKNVNKTIGKIAAEAKKNWDDSKKDSGNISKENKTVEYFEQFADSLSDSITDGAVLKLTNNVSLVDVEEDAFRYKGNEGWTTLGNRMPFKDIIQAFLDNNKVRQDIKKNKNLSGLAVQHASYFVRVLNMFQDYLVTNNLSFDNLASDTVELKNYVLIIDEINRANLSSVLGELIYALEYRDDTVHSMYAIDEKTDLILPPNLYIIGTMNTADRSVGHIDYAIRRRFAFIDVMPKDLSLELKEKFHKSLFEQVSNLFSTNLSAEFEMKDVQLGHSYFIDKSDTGGSRDIRLEYEIKPILREYIKDGILVGDGIKDKIENLSF